MAQLAFTAAQGIQEGNQPLAAQPVGQHRGLLPAGRAHSAQLLVLRCNGSEQQIPEQGRQPLEDGRRFPPLVKQLPHHLQEVEGLIFGQGRAQLQQALFRDGTHEVPHRFRRNGRRQQAELIQQTLGVPQSPLGQLGNETNGLRGDVDGFLARNPAQMLHHVGQRNAAEIEALAAGHDGGQHPLGIGGGQHEHHLGRRLFQGFEQGVEGRRRQHVAFVHHVHLPAGLHRRKTGPFDQFADVVHAGVGRRIDFNDVQGISCRDGGAELAGAAGFRRWLRRGKAVEGASEDTGTGRFAGSPRAGEQVGRSNALLLQGIGEGAGNGRLTHQLVEPLRTVAMVDRLVAHGLLQQLSRQAVSW